MTDEGPGGKGADRKGGDAGSLDASALIESLLKRVTGQIAAPETPQERAARLKREGDEAEHAREQAAKDKDLERRKDFILFVVLVVTVSVVGVASLWVVLRPGYPPNITQWATTTLTTIAAAGVGYKTGKAIKSD